MTGGPPKDVAPETLFARLTAMPRPQKLVQFPRKDPATGSFVPEQVCIVVLTAAEMQKARAAAEAYTLDLLRGNPDGVPFKQVVDVVGGRSLAYDEIYRNELAIETLVIACREPTDVTQPCFPNSQLARKFMTVDEITCLFMSYCDHMAESGPIVSSMSVPTMDAWIQRLQEGASRVPLAQVSLEGVKDLLMHLVSRQSKSSTGSGSAGSQQSGNSSGTEPSLASADERPEPVIRDE